MSTRSLRFVSSLALVAGVAVLALPSTASAQATDPTAPVPAPAPAPDAAQPGTGAAPAPGSFSAQGTAQAGTESTEEEEPAGEDAGEKRKPGAAWWPWRGSALNWSHDVTTTAVGIGRDNIGGEGEVYSQGLGFTLNYFVIDEKDFRLRLTTSVGFDVELTDGGTTTRNEPRFRDMPLTIATGGLTVAQSEDKMWALGFIPNFTTIFPTSPNSHDRGVYLTTSPRLLTYFTAPILGADAEHLQGFFGGISVRWDHTFSRANVPTNSDVNRPRRTPNGGTFLSDQISGGRVWDNRLRVGGFVFFEEKFGDATFWLFAGPSWSVDFLPEFSDVDCVQIDTGCVEVASNPNASSTRISAGFSAGISVFPMAEWGVDLGYSNNTLQLGEDGTRRDIFYSPDASFTATLIVSVDAIYERLVGPKRESPVIIFGQNQQAPGAAPAPFTSPTGTPSMPAVF